MADTYGNATVDATADVIVANLTVRRTVLLRNNGSVPVYLGFDSSVTTTNGMPLNPQGTIELKFGVTKRGTAIYGVTASSSTDIRYLILDQ